MSSTDAQTPGNSISPSYPVGPTDNVKHYNALLWQGEFSAPNVWVPGKNTIGDIDWSYNAEGEYYGTLTGAFPEHMTQLLATANSDDPGYIIQAKRVNNNVISIRTLKLENDGEGGYSFQPSNDLLNGASLQINVYNSTYNI